MKITLLRISNFLKLKDVEMNPSKTNVIVGKNRQGKTSILKAIRTAFTGDADSSSIRQGENKAEIIVELDDLVIRRSITEKSSQLDVTNKEGFKIPSPQKYLNGILGTFSFNPVEFFNLKPSDRKKYLLNAIKLTLTQDELAEFTGEKLAGIDYEQHALEVVEAARKYYYDLRTGMNAKEAEKKKVLADLKAQVPEGFNERSVSEEEITKLRDAIQTDEKEKLREEAHLKSIKALQDQETDLKVQIEALTTKLKGIQDEIIAASQVEFDYSDDVTLEAARQSLLKLEGQRGVLFTLKRIKEVSAELETASQAANHLDGVVKKLAKEVPDILISRAELPIEGLTISGDEILINGVNIDNLSTSEQLRFGLQVVRALNGDFKVICVDGIETMDKESFEFFLKEIENDDYQYFVTRVDGATDKSIEIEDGAIKA